MGYELSAELLEAANQIDWDLAYSHALGLARVFDRLNSVAQREVQRSMAEFDPNHKDSTIRLNVQGLAVNLTSVRGVGADLRDLQVFLADSGFDLDDDDDAKLTAGGVIC